MATRNELPADRLWKIDEAAAYLRVHVNTVRKYIKEGDLPHERVGPAYRFRREDLDEWVNEQAEAA